MHLEMNKLHGSVRKGTEPWEACEGEEKWVNSWGEIQHRWCALGLRFWLLEWLNMQKCHHSLWVSHQTGIQMWTPRAGITPRGKPSRLLGFLGTCLRGVYYWQFEGVLESAVTYWFQCPTFLLPGCSIIKCFFVFSKMPQCVSYNP